ncbi:putative leader peptide [Nocardiopsis endophytica]|uniref:putative leader peptide n=1 Tax=Nocardiopsis endophytica TaxID=3018445 RepID=UPI0038CD831D
MHPRTVGIEPQPQPPEHRPRKTGNSHQAPVAAVNGDHAHARYTTALPWGPPPEAESADRPPAGRPLPGVGHRRIHPTSGRGTGHTCTDVTGLTPPTPGIIGRGPLLFLFVTNLWGLTERRHVDLCRVASQACR